MATRDELIDLCNSSLECESFEGVDYGPNGLQVPGRREVSKVATCVSANLESLRRAVEAEAEMVIAHHGLFWEFLPRSLTERSAARLRCLLEADASLAAYHLPLDASPTLGNNALLCRGLGLAIGEPFGEARGRKVGFVGTPPEPLSTSELGDKIESLLGRPPLAQGAEPTSIRAVGVISGAGASSIHEAAELGLDALITGEPAEHVMADAAEAGIAFFGAGHYATETLGVRALGDFLAAELGIEHEFVDVPNPV